MDPEKDSKKLSHQAERQVRRQPVRSTRTGPASYRIANFEKISAQQHDRTLRSGTTASPPAAPAKKPIAPAKKAAAPARKDAATQTDPDSPAIGRIAVVRKRTAAKTTATTGKKAASTKQLAKQTTDTRKNGKPTGDKVTGKVRVTKSQKPIGPVTGTDRTKTIAKTSTAPPRKITLARMLEKSDSSAREPSSSDETDANTEPEQPSKKTKTATPTKSAIGKVKGARIAKLARTVTKKSTTWLKKVTKAHQTQEKTETSESRSFSPDEIGKSKEPERITKRSKSTTAKKPTLDKVREALVTKPAEPAAKPIAKKRKAPERRTLGQAEVAAVIPSSQVNVTVQGEMEMPYNPHPGRNLSSTSNKFKNWDTKQNDNDQAPRGLVVPDNSHLGFNRSSTSDSSTQSDLPNARAVDTFAIPSSQIDKEDPTLYGGFLQPKGVGLLLNPYLGLNPAFDSHTAPLRSIPPHSNPEDFSGLSSAPSDLTDQAPSDSKANRQAHQSVELQGPFSRFSSPYSQAPADHSLSHTSANDYAGKLIEKQRRKEARMKAAGKELDD